MRDHTHALTSVIHTESYAFCTGNRHGRRIRVATFSEQGLHGWCKTCHAEVIISWAELAEIRRGFEQRKGQLA